MAQADTPTPDALQALEAVTARDDTSAGEASDVLDNVSPSSRETREGEIVNTREGVTATVPADTGNALQIGEVGVVLPFSEQGAEARQLQDGVIAFDNENGSTTVPVLKTDGSVQVATVISSASAPQEYSYSLNLPPEATVAIGEAGVVLVTRGDSLLLGIAPPWAIDADGTPVPTHYELDGTTLVQVVDHAATNFTYPIVADPWLGAALFGNVYTNNILQKVWGSTTPWGTAVQTGVGVGSWGLGQGIMKTAGWDEWANKAPLSRSKATYHQQFDCHVLGAYTPATGGPTWDLEGTRGNRPNWAVDGGAYPYKCNWP